MIISIEFFINMKEKLSSGGTGGRGVLTPAQYSKMLLTGITMLNKVMIHTAEYI